jgi:BolA family transcriptional regulator, general stress-responsive regulator
LTGQILAPPATTVDRIRDTLSAGLDPERLEVIDESGLHAGHGGAVPGKTTHVRVRILSAAFSGKSRIDRHRLVNGLLASEITAGLHALAIEAQAPGE